MDIVIYMIVIVLLLLSAFYESNVYQRKKKADQQTISKQKPCDKLSQSDLRVNLHFVIENGKEDKFADYTAVYGYPNYLFRTDSKQKWTNEETEDNFCLFRSGDISSTDWKYYEERQHLNRYLRTEFHLLASKKSITSKKFYQRIRFFNLWFASEDGRTINVAFSEEIIAMVKAVMKKLGDDNRIIPLCAVGHADEGISHIHFLYYIKYPYKKVSSVREILKMRGIDTKSL